MAAYRTSLACCATAFLPAPGQGYEWNSSPLSWLASFLTYSLHHHHQSSICLTFDLVVGFDGLHVPFFALCFCHPDSATPFGSITLLRLIRLYSFFPFSHSRPRPRRLDLDHYYYFFALVQRPEFIRDSLRNQRLPHPALRSITFIHNALCRHATFRGQALPTTNLQRPFHHI